MTHPADSLTHRALRSVFIDLDDTLFDHSGATTSALAAVRAGEPAFACWPLDELDRRHAIVLELWHERLMAGLVPIHGARVGRFEELLNDAGADRAHERAVEIARVYRGRYETSWRCVNGARELLAFIKAMGVQVIVVTNNVVVEQEQKLAQVGLAPYVDALIASEAVGAQKPDVRIFEAALARAGVARGGVVMFGDAWRTDIVGAIAAGIRPVWFNPRGVPSPDASVAELRSLEPAAAAWSVLAREPAPR